jgi:diguanylate cyclase (GGDEF)-like protein
MNELKLMVAAIVVGVALIGLAMAYYYRARRLSRLFDEQADELRSLLKKILRIEEELEFVLEFIREIPHLTGELNNQMNPRGLPEVLLNVITRTFRPEQAVVLIRRRKTLAQPDGDNQFVAAAVAAPRATCSHGMVIGMGEGELGYVAQQQRVLDRAGLEREAASYRNIRAKGLAAFRADLAAPMHIDEKTMGIIALRRPERQKPYSVDVFRVIAQMGAFALNNLAAYTEVKSVADVDPLTKIWNKGVLSFRLGEVIFEAEENKHDLSVFIFDIDYFKNYNDVNGHVAGDRLLQLLARLVKEQTRADDTFGRFGGEEFLLILPRKTRSQAKITGEKIREVVEAYDFPFGDKQPLGRLTISGGVACFPNDGRNSSELIRAADQALYEAKRLGRNRVEAAGNMSLDQG